MRSIIERAALWSNGARETRRATPASTLIAMSQSRISFTSEQLNISKAIKLIKSTLKLSREVLGKLHPQSIGLTRQLANCYYRAGRNEEAIEQFEQTLSLYGELAVENDPWVPITKNGLALAYAEIGRYEDAAKLHEYTLQNFCEQFGERHPNTIAGMRNWRSTTWASVGTTKPSSCMKRRWKISRKMLGPWNHTTLIVSNSSSPCLSRGRSVCGGQSTVRRGD